MQNVLLASLFCLAISIDCVAKAQLTLGEMESWKIICSPAATAAEAYAASEFQKLFKGLTDIELPIEKIAAGNISVVLIGPDAVAAHGSQVKGVELGEEGLRLDVSPQKVEISGGRPRGTLYGVYEFFEELCGVRFLTHDHTYYLKDGKKIKIYSRRDTHVPTFTYRYSFYGETNQNPAFAARLHTNTVGGETLDRLRMIHGLLVST